MRYDYPGNIRELENAMERAVVLARGMWVTQADLPAEIADTLSGSAVRQVRSDVGELDRRLAELECSLITNALAASGGNKSAAARQLGISERRLRSRIARLGLAPDPDSAAHSPDTF
ncbi:MAG: helix-turn-helix domain-containing protein [Spirochaetales bacterium]